MGIPSIFCSEATNIQADKTTGSGTKPIRYLSRSKKPMPIEGYAGSAAASMAAGAAVYMLKDDLGLGEVAESPAGTVRSLLYSYEENFRLEMLYMQNIKARVGGQDCLREF